MLKVHFHKSDLCLSTICVICGRTFVIDKVEAILWEDDKRIGNVCKGCVKEGSQGLSKILREQVQKLKEKVKILEELSNQKISCPSWEDYENELSEEKEMKQRIIMYRILLIGEGIVPSEDLEGVRSEDIKVFLTEPDPDKWPSEIQHMKKYVEMELDIQNLLSRPYEL
jgi:hypothetical protein